MIDIALWQTDYPAPPDPQSPAEVDFLIVCEETAVQSASLPIILGTYHQSRPRGPHHVAGIVILPTIALHRLKDTSTTEGIAEPVDESPTRPRIFETVLVNDRKQLRLTGRHLGMSIQILDQGRQPVMRHLDIRVQQHKVFRLNLSQRLVVAIGKSPIPVHDDLLHLRKMLRKHCQGVVSRGIVSHIHGCLVAGILKHRRQILLHHAASIPIQDYDCHFFHARVPYIIKL